MYYKNKQEAENEYNGGKAIKIVNKAQVGFYAEYECQPAFVCNGLDNKLVFYYYKEDTLYAWRKWKESSYK